MAPYANNYGNRPFVPYPNSYETQNKWKPAITHSSNENTGKQQELDKNKLGDIWIPKIIISVGKESHNAILYLGSSVNILSKELYDILDLDKKTRKV
jgi:hypothetical protein